MFVIFNTLFFIFIINSKISFINAAAHHETDYEEDERNLIPDWTDLDSDKETRELLIRELLLNRFGRILEQQQQQRHQPPFTYNFPPPRAEETFGVPPSDPRYYEIPNNNDGLQKGDERFLRHMKSDDVVLNSDKKEDSGLVRGDNLEAGPSPVIDKNGNKDIDDDDDLHISIADNLQDGDDETAVLSMPAPVPLAVQVIKTPIGDFQATRDDMIFVAIVAGCSAAAVLIIAAIGFGWYRLHKKAKAAADVDYPAYGVTGPNKEVSPTGDRKLAESAQMYHYQHQKQQIISMSSSRASNENRGSGSEAESDEENEEGDYTVYECPGLAATGEMEVKNPLFQDDPTPANGNQNNTICPTSPAGDKSGDKSNQNQK